MKTDKVNGWLIGLLFLSIATNIIFGGMFFALIEYGIEEVEKENELIELEIECIDYCLGINSYDYEYNYQTKMCGCYDGEYNLLDYYRD